jgi:superfamily II DNA or RNA helicase
MTGEQIDTLHAATGMLLPGQAGGICSRSTLGQIAKGRHKGNDIATNKNTYIRGLVDSWPAESTLIWCIFNAEQDAMKATFPEAGSISGDTPMEERIPMIADFKAGKLKTLITKPKVLGFGLNLQVATRQVFSGLQDSYESYYQAVKRSNRYGAKFPLNVHIPLTDLERPMVETVLEKADRIHADTEAQEAIFMEIRNNVLA